MTFTQLEKFEFYYRNMVGFFWIFSMSIIFGTVGYINGIIDFFLAKFGHEVLTERPIGIMFW